MLEIIIPENEFFDESKNEFITTKSVTLRLEHSLVSISKWESKWKKPFISSTKNNQEFRDYIRCMLLDDDIPEYLLYVLTPEDYRKIHEYIESDMTATWFKTDNKYSRNREIVTSEIIYYWMVSMNIPLECEKWHLNRLLTFIRVCNEKNAPKKKMSTAEILRNNRELNAARKKMLNSNG